MQRFLEYKGYSVKLENEWFNGCKQAASPFVAIRVRAKYAEVIWDCISMPISADDQVTARETEINGGLSEIFNSYCNDKSRYNFTAYTGSFDKLYHEDARAAADRIFAILMDKAAVAVV